MTGRTGCVPNGRRHERAGFQISKKTVDALHEGTQLGVNVPAGRARLYHSCAHYSSNTESGAAGCACIDIK